MKVIVLRPALAPIQQQQILVMVLIPQRLGDLNFTFFGGWTYKAH